MLTANVNIGNKTNRNSKKTDDLSTISKFSFYQIQRHLWKLLFDNLKYIYGIVSSLVK